MCYWVPIPFPQNREDYLTISADQRNWIKDRPEIDISKLLLKAIRNQMRKDTEIINRSPVVPVVELSGVAHVARSQWLRTVSALIIYELRDQSLSQA
jgi:hypothetical protein